MFDAIAARKSWLPALAFLLGLAWDGLVGARAGDEPARKPGDESRETLERIVKGYELFLGADGSPLAMEREPVLRWPNPTRDTQEGATFVWTRDGRPEALACVWENGGFWAHAFHSLSDSKLIAKHQGRIIWQPQKAGIEFSAFPKAPQPADSAAKRLVQMKELTRRFACRLTDVDRKPEELRCLPRPIFRYKTERKDLVDGALFAFVQGTDPEVVLVLEAVRRDAEAEWRFALTRRTGYAVEADLDGKRFWSVPGGSGGPTEAWFVSRLGTSN